MAQGWRIIREKHAAGAFSGEGARRFGGRWNSRGISVVYTSSTKSLAALEILVHLNPPVSFRYVAVRIKFNDALIETIRSTTLPADWAAEPPSPSSQVIGDAWVQAGSSAVLAVPSAIVSDESNYLLNPAHPDFNKIMVSAPELFAFDRRLLA